MIFSVAKHPCLHIVLYIVLYDIRTIFIMLYILKFEIGFFFEFQTNDMLSLTVPVTIQTIHDVNSGIRIFSKRG